MKFEKIAIAFIAIVFGAGCSDSNVDWKQLARDRYAPTEELIFGSGATQQQWKELEEKGVIEWPTEFRSLYNEFNGFAHGSSEEPEWLLVPLNQTPSLTAHIRSWFQETHPDQAARFVAFIDWGNGDATGYMMMNGGGWVDGLYTFNHEFYEFEAKQDWQEFLIKEYSSI